jgi:hypothetical protein
MIARINIKDKGGQSFYSVAITEIKALADKDIPRLAKVTEEILHDKIRNAIAENPYGSMTGNLIRHFRAEPLHIPGRVGWGVGDIAELDREAKGWRHLNYGSIAIGANWEHWLPKGRWISNRWVPDPEGYWFKPTKPIAPRNYIEKTIADLQFAIDRVLSEKR